MKRDYLDTLNKQQRKAVITTEGQVLVIAGAGSGKTTTMIYRVAHLIEKGVHPNNILLLTFTNKAANEMLARVKRLLKLKGNCTVEGGTFHSFAVSVLRTYPKEAGLRRGFTILDEDDNMSVIKHLMDTTDFPKGIKGLTKGKISKLNSYAINTKTDLETLVASSMAAMFPTENLEFGNDDTVQQIELEDDASITILASMENMSNLAKKLTAAIMRLWSNYVRYKYDHNMVSFDDLLVHLVNLLKKKDIRKKLAKRFKYVMVDEYQDTNLLQIDIVRRLGMAHKNVMAVGDPAQSIYSFRGAYVNNIFSFSSMFKKAKCKIIKLGQNYRSTAPILELANGILNTFDKERKYSVELFTKTAKGKISPELYIASSFGKQQSQARFVIDKIKERKQKGIDYDDIAILTRISRVTVEVELELYKNKIPFVKIGGVKFFDQAHMKDVLAFLRIALNPKDVLAWKRLLKNVPGVGPKIADDIVKEFLERGPEDTLNLSRFKVRKYYSALYVIARTVRLTSKKSMPIARRLEFIYEWYKPIYEARYEKNTDKVKDPGLVAGEINAVKQLSLDYGADLEQMMIDLSLDSEYAKNKKEDQTGKVVVSTIHGAKGLEWNTVFLISLIDGVLPSRAALFTSENLNEERRLLYVAATRAKKRLYMVAPEPVVDESNVVTRNSMAISRFLLEINDLDNLVSSNYKIAHELGHPK